MIWKGDSFRLVDSTLLSFLQREELPIQKCKHENSSRPNTKHLLFFCIMYKLRKYVFKLFFLLESMVKVSFLAKRIKSKLDEKRISAYKLEKSIGLKRSAINNIIYGKSRNPGIESIQAIAKGLNCSISDLLGEEGHLVFQQKLTSLESYILQRLNTPIDNYPLYLQVLEVFGKFSQKSSAKFSRIQLMKCIEEIYSYSIKRGKNEVDIYFVEWILEKYEFSSHLEE